MATNWREKKAKAWRGMTDPSVQPVWGFWLAGSLRQKRDHCLVGLQTFCDSYKTRWLSPVRDTVVARATRRQKWWGGHLRRARSLSAVWRRCAPEAKLFSPRVHAVALASP